MPISSPASCSQDDDVVAYYIQDQAISLMKFVAKSYEQNLLRKVGKNVVKPLLT